MNLERAQDYMDRYRLKALIASSPVNVAYFTGFDCWLYRKYRENMLVLGSPAKPKEAFAVLPAHGKPLLIIDSYTSLYASELDIGELCCYGYSKPKIRVRSDDGKAKHTSFFSEAVSKQKSSPAEALVSAVKRAGANKGKVGVEASSMRADTFGVLHRSLPDVEFRNCDELLGLIRMVKSREEIKLLKRAAKINEYALYKSLERAGEGTKIGELARVYLSEISREGAIFDHYFYSPDGLYLSAAENYRLRRGEYTMIDSGCTYDLYYGDMATTLLVGHGKKEVVKRYKVIWETIKELADSIEPGEAPSSIMKKFGSLYAKSGIKNPDYQGHGIGLEPREYPIMGHGGAKKISDGIVSVNTDIRLEEGMVISLETSVYDFGEGSFEIERSFVVGKNSLQEITSKRDREIFISS